ncbi:glycosyltransferase family 2 protein [Psychroflexus sp. CAK57W]|uniref:glycosyltransferase family 2 protein n=1 Tax=Psychroflexus curvus TaxID=2873595 RepID=UPI001CCB2DB2|nr:glycosyltransferase family 2 protein [Psychroflexus curvus]MBZ9787849.1 glycosyltransferase family 2 protein [Psychroflexus curvus]
MSHKTFIIIVTYNAMHWLDQCLGSIDLKQYDVVVVDNNSEDETCSRIESEYSQIKLFKEQQNLGFGQANNKGISYALNQGAEHVLLLNQDAYLIDEALEKLLYFQKNNPEYGILSPIHTNADQNRLDRNFSNYVKFDVNPDFYSDHVLENKLKPVYVVPFVNAAGWLISKECLMTVGGFDPIFFHYGEDDNYCQRVLYHGFDIGVLPKVFMIHDREDRPKVEIEKYSEAYFEQQERRLKLMYANVNAYDNSKLFNYRKKIKRQLLKARLRQNKPAIKGLKSYLRMIDRFMPEIEKSVEINKIQQPSYLVLNK